MALIWPTYVVEAHPGHRDPAGDGGRDDDVAAAGFQVGQGEVGRVHRAPEVEILRTRWRKNMIAILCLSRICVYMCRVLLTITSWKAVMLVISSKKQLDHTHAFATR